MAEFIVRNLEEDLHDQLQEMACREGRDLEEIVRDILRNAILRDPKPEKGLGTRLAERFSRHNLATELPELPRQQAEPTSFKP